MVDVLLGALGRAAASQGTMNNVAFGDERFGYYETIGGGAGAGPDFDGASGVHTHMTNTRITDPEVLEARYPGAARRVRAAPRLGRRGALARRRRARAPLPLPRARHRVAAHRAARVAPFGLAGGAPGARGRNAVVRRDGRVEELPSPRGRRARARRRARDRDARRRRLRRAGRRVTLAPAAPLSKVGPRGA